MEYNWWWARQGLMVSLFIGRSHSAGMIKQIFSRDLVRLAQRTVGGKGNHLFDRNPHNALVFALNEPASGGNG